MLNIMVQIIPEIDRSVCIFFCSVFFVACVFLTKGPLKGHVNILVLYEFLTITGRLTAADTICI